MDDSDLLGGAIAAHADQYGAELRGIAASGVAYYREWLPVVGAERAWELVRQWHASFWYRAARSGFDELADEALGWLPPLQDLGAPPPASSE